MARLVALGFILSCLLGLILAMERNETLPAWRNNRFLVWMCLERCGDNTTEIQAQLHTIAVEKKRNLITDVSFEIYNLGPKATLVKNNLSSVAAALKKIGVDTYAMISSFPHPPQFLTWMRYLFQHPQSFIAQCIQAQSQVGFTGFDIDFEPTVTATPQDAIDYANFLDLFSKAMHSHGIKVQVDIASWNPIWNWTAIGESAVDRVMSMDTYAGSWTNWAPAFNRSLSLIPLAKIAIGLENVDPNSGNASIPLSDQQLQDRFDLINPAKIPVVGVWDMPVPSNYWPFIRNYRK